MRHAHTLGNKDPIFHKIFPFLLKQMKESYPELEMAKDLILTTLFNEESKFKQTIDNGLKILNDEINDTTNELFSGDIAFKLYDTYGFPLDLTQDYLKTKNMNVDLKQFDSNMVLQKERARRSWKGTGDIADENIWLKLTESLESTDFIGYENEIAECNISKIILNNSEINSLKFNDEAFIILNQTPFYAESGGQIGDRGKLENENFIFNVINTTKIFGRYFLHCGNVIKGTCKINDQLTASININKRNLIKNNHSSTHLLQAALKKILGNHISQKGSLVNAEKLRFDFSHSQQISSNDLEKIELLVNDIIKQNHPIKIQILDHQSAINEGAIALFGENYGQEVRVVSMGKLDNKFFSKELCGGTHVNNTGEINKFKIINQSPVSSGVRRLEAVTNMEVDNYNKNLSIKNTKNTLKIKKELDTYLSLLNKINSKINVNLNKFDKFEDKLKEVKKIYYEVQNTDQIAINKKNVIKEKIGEFNFIYLKAINYPSNSFKNFIDEHKKNNTKSIIVLVSTNDQKVSIIIGLTDDLNEQLDARKLVTLSSKIVGGKGGGGRNDLAQAGGNIKKNIPQIFESIREQISKLT